MAELVKKYDNGQNEQERKEIGNEGVSKPDQFREQFHKITSPVRYQLVLRSWG
jgi:hypothetical protein